MNGAALLTGLGCWALVGCSAARDVEVSGKVTAPSSVVVGPRVVIDFVDMVGDGPNAEHVVVSSAELSSLGEFRERVALEGDQVLIVAIDDRNGDGKCTLGEAWDQVYAPVVGSRVTAQALMLGFSDCPAGS